MRLSYDVDDTPETIEQWIEGNVHLLPTPSAVTEGYRYLSRADEYLGYTYRRQYYSLWRYATAVMLLGVADAAGGKGIHARIMPPERWQKMSTAKKQKAIRTITLNKIAGALRIPQSTLREHYLDTISLLVEHDPATYVRELMFDADQPQFFPARQGTLAGDRKIPGFRRKGGKRAGEKTRKRKNPETNPAETGGTVHASRTGGKKTSFPVSVNTVRRVLRL